MRGFSFHFLRLKRLLTKLQVKNYIYSLEKKMQYFFSFFSDSDPKKRAIHNDPNDSESVLLTKVWLLRDDEGCAWLEDSGAKAVDLTELLHVHFIFTGNFP